VVDLNFDLCNIVVVKTITCLVVLQTPNPCIIRSMKNISRSMIRVRYLSFNYSEIVSFIVDDFGYNDMTIDVAYNVLT